MADGDTITVYVSTMDPRESFSVPRDVQIAAVERSKASAQKNYAKADALHKTIIDTGYRLVYNSTHKFLFIGRLLEPSISDCVTPQGSKSSESGGSCTQVPD